MIVEQYFYELNFPQIERELCALEMRSLFGMTPESKQFFSERDVSPSCSPFLKTRIAVWASATSFETLMAYIPTLDLPERTYRVHYIKTEGTDLSYEDRLRSVQRTAEVVPSVGDMDNPEIHYGVAKVGERWIFGEYERNDFTWHAHDTKPFTYSHSLSVRYARALVNIATGYGFNGRMIDPCCGVGTVVIEGLSLGLNIVGNEINRKSAWNARRNLMHFGYDPELVTRGDIGDVIEQYDVALVDIPYGVFVPVTREQQMHILVSACRIATRMVLVAFEPMEDMVEAAGYRVADSGTVTKGQFVRYVYVCERVRM
ncbi:MAG: TRM11 family SAM-dependent methyltransferase [Bacilli bacterium]